MTGKSPDSGSGRWLFVSDVDDTLLGDDEGLRTLFRAMELAPQKPTVVYNSSRPCASVRRSIEAKRQLPIPDFLIGALGTEIQEGRGGNHLSAYSNHIGVQWDRERVAALADELGFTAHPAEFQTPFKASYNVEGISDVREMRRRLAAERLDVKAIFSGRTNLDLIPPEAGKGSAIQFLRRQLGISRDYVVVSGDSGNDVEMFEAPNKGIVVANADDDLKRLRSDHIYHAAAPYAAGVLEGLRYWGVLPYT